MSDDKLILVKKADGTFIRKKLSDLKSNFKVSPTTSARIVPQSMADRPNPSLPVRQAGSGPLRRSFSEAGRRGGEIIPPPVAKPTEDKKPAPIVRLDSNETPVAPRLKPQAMGQAMKQLNHTPLKVDRPQVGHAAPIHKSVKAKDKKKWTREDSSSLLEEKLGIKDESRPLTSPKREKEVEIILKKLNFSVPPNFISRLRGIIQLRLKDLRTEEETRATVLRPIKEGGLGLTEAQAEKLLDVCHNVLQHPLISHEASLPMAEPAEIPAVSTPFNAFVHSKNYSPAPMGPAPAQTEKKTEAVFKLSSQPVVKQSMQDISAPPAEMGPVEEVKYFSLTDFRRLSNNPSESARRLKQKLFNLQEESFVLYIDGLLAYHLCPLYLDYMQMICLALSSRRPLAAVLADKNRIQLEELKALVRMEREL